MNNNLVISEEKDLTTSCIIDWLLYKGAKTKRINVEHAVTNLSIEIDNDLDEIMLTTDMFDLSNIQSILIRRGFVRLNLPRIMQNLVELKIDKSCLSYVKQELSVVENFIDRNLTDIKHSGQSVLYRGDKFQTLAFAREIGLDIPPTLLTTEKSKLKMFKNKHNEIITKTIDFQFHFNDNIKDETFMLYTNELSDALIDSLPDSFFPSLFQKKVHKDYELRILYVENKFFPVAIFSQTNNKTTVDFRHYDSNKPNRNIPYLLPLFLEKKLRLLMEKCELNTGSIDIIKGKDNKFYFLEVNHCGQFGGVTYRCNYHAEKYIAESLM